jgi:hypothetical protein
LHLEIVAELFEPTGWFDLPCHLFTIAALMPQLGCLRFSLSHLLSIAPNQACTMRASVSSMGGRQMLAFAQLTTWPIDTAKH